MNIVLKIVLFIPGCILALCLLGIAIVGAANITSRDDALLALLIGIVWAITYWPVTLIAIGLAIWGVFWWGSRGPGSSISRRHQKYDGR